MSVRDTVYDIAKNLNTLYGNRNNTNQRIVNRLKQIKNYIRNDQPLPVNFQNNSNEIINNKIEGLKRIIGQAGINSDREAAKADLVDTINTINLNRIRHNSNNNNNNTDYGIYNGYHNNDDHHNNDDGNIPERESAATRHMAYLGGKGRSRYRKHKTRKAHRARRNRRSLRRKN